MASQQALSQRVKLVAGTALVCVGLTMVPIHQNEPAPSVTCFVATAAWRTIELLPAFAPAVSRALQGYVFDPQWLSSCPVQLLVSSLSLLRLAFGGA